MSWSRIQGNFNAGGGAVTLGGAVGSGNILCVGVYCSSNSATVTLTDNKSNTYTLVDTVNPAFTTDVLKTYYVVNVTNGPNVITASTSAGSLAIFVDEFSFGSSTASSALDGHIGRVGTTLFGTGANAVTTGNFTTVTNGDLLWVVGLGDHVLTAGTSPISYTAANNDSADDNLTEWAIQTTASSSTVGTMTHTSGSGFVALGAIALSAPSSGTTVNLTGAGSLFAAGSFTLSGRNLNGVGSLFAAGTATDTVATTLTGAGIPYGALSSGGGFQQNIGLTNAGSLFAAGILSPSKIVSLTGAGSLYAAGSFSPAIVIGLNNTGSLYAAGSFVETIAEGLTGAGSLFAAGSFSQVIAITLGNAGSLFAAGSFAEIVAKSLTGAGSLYAAGSFTISGGGTVALTGAGSLYAAGGSVPPWMQNINLDNAGSLFAAGTLGIGSTSVNLTGAGSLFAAGAFAKTIVEAFGGAGSLFAAGSLTPGGSASFNLVGAGSLFGAGSLTPTTAETLALLGAGSMYAAGSLTPSTLVSIALGGSGSLFGAGQLTPSVPGGFTLIGASSPFAAGAFALTSSSTKGLTGAGSLFAAGSLAELVARALTGVGSSFSAGTLGIVGSSTLSLIGVGSRYAAGVLTFSVPGIVDLIGTGSPYAAGTLTQSEFIVFPLSGVGSPFAAGSFAVAITDQLVPSARSISSLSKRAFASLVQVDMPQGPDFSPMDTGEIVTGAIDFAQWLTNGATIETILSVDAENFPTEGGSPYVSLVGNPAIGTVSKAIGGSGQAGTAVLQQWEGQTIGVARVAITIETSDGQTFIGWAHQPVFTPD